MTAVVKQLNTYPYTDIHTPTQAHKHTPNANNYIYQKSKIILTWLAHFQREKHEHYAIQISHPKWV